MRTIKEVGLLSLIKDGDLVKAANNIVANECITADLTKEEIKASLDIIEDMNNKFVDCSNKVDDLKIVSERRKRKVEYLVSYSEKKKIDSKKITISAISGLFLIILCFIIVVFFGKCFFSEPLSTDFIIIVIATAITSLVSYMDIKIQTKILNRKKQKAKEKCEKIEKEIEELNRQEADICKEVYTNTIEEANILMPLLLSIKSCLKKIIVIASDTTLNSSDKFIKMETLLSLYRQELYREEQLSETKKTTQLAKEQVAYAQQQAEYFREQAESAKEQVESAKEQAEYSKKQAEYAKEQAENSKKQAEYAKRQAEQQEESNRKQQEIINELHNRKY